MKALLLLLALATVFVAVGCSSSDGPDENVPVVKPGDPSDAPPGVKPSGVTGAGGAAPTNTPAQAPTTQ